MEIIIEEINRGQKLIGRHKFASEHITIGRGYHNDIIVSDPHVCANHLSIDFDGEHWTVADQESINGSFLADGKKSAHGHVIRSGDIFSLGQSQIRVVFPDHPVEPSATLSPFENLINLARQPLVLAASIGLFTLIVAWTIFLNNPKEMGFTQLLVPAIGMTLMFLMWPALVSLISHLTKHDARVLTQLGVSFIIYNLSWVTDFIETFVSFNTSSSFLLMPLLTLLPVSLAFCLFWLNCYIGFHMSGKRRAFVAASLTVLLFGGSYLIQLSKQPEFTIKPRFNNVLMTPNFVFAPSSDVDSFIEQSDKLFKKADSKIDDEKAKQSHSKD
ncbi:FHA domain-containing protein [Thalassotalea piscium]